MGRGRKREALVVEQEARRIDAAELKPDASVLLDGQPEGGERVQKLGSMFEPSDTPPGSAAPPRPPAQPPRTAPTPPLPPKTTPKVTPVVPPLNPPREMKRTSSTYSDAPLATVPNSIKKSHYSGHDLFKSRHRDSIALEDSVSGRSDNVLPLLEGGAGQTIDVQGDMKERLSYRKSGRCKDMGICDCMCLIGVVIVGVAIVLLGVVILPEAGSGDEVAPPDPTTYPILPGSVSTAFYDYKTGLPLGNTLTMKAFNEGGVKIDIVKTGGAFFDPGVATPLSTSAPAPTTTRRAIFSQKVAFHSNVSVDAQPNGFAANIDAIYNEFGEFLLFEPSRVVIAIKNGVNLEGSKGEFIKIWLNGEGAVGLPFTFALQGEEITLPEGAQSEIKDEGSKVASVVGVASSMAMVGSAAGVAAIPRLHLIASAFTCPSADYFEVTWITHPLSLLDFPDIDIGNYPALAPHISAFTGAYIILGGTLLILFLISYGAKVFGRSLTWRASLGAGRFPHFVLEFYMFLLPGVALMTMQVLFYHPNSGAQAYAVLSFILLVLIPIGLIAYLLNSSYFVAELVECEDKRLMSVFVLGRREWECENDESFLKRYGLFFQDYSIVLRSFLLIELFMSASFGIAEAVNPGTRQGCMWRSWSLLAFSTFHLGALLFLRPLIAGFEMSYAVLLAVANELILFFIVVNQHENDTDHWTATAAAVCAIGANWAIRVKCFLDILVFIYELVYGAKGFRADDNYTPLPGIADRGLEMFPDDKSQKSGPPSSVPTVNSCTITVGMTAFSTNQSGQLLESSNGHGLTGGQPLSTRPSSAFGGIPPYQPNLGLTPPTTADFNRSTGGVSTRSFGRGSFAGSSTGRSSRAASLSSREGTW